MTDHLRRAIEVFAKAPFVTDLGIEVADVGEGWVETRVEISSRLRQQHGFAHAGVVATLADHTAGAAASTVIHDDKSVLTANYTIHLLRPGSDEVLTCRGDVVRAGRTLIVTQADVWADGKLCARYTGTMTVVDRAL
ncbi:MAG TPA: PaaI family thioesterase [Acidimicrobiia bacterium]|nr:PaaI family thioesterase [Acidimicrobiia bacterium]